ncbi:MAG TPA: arylesterase [Rhodospirillales bacterium]|jgi:acyl-CoA thioesterase-1|nr:arylesterase [Rhodospirillales bacterium]HIL76294.1 arylesterase [Rhodospirillales bacterium]
MVLKYVTHMFLSWRRSSRFYCYGSIFFVPLTILSLVNVPSNSSEITQPVIKLMIFGDSLTAGYGLKRSDSFSEKLSNALKSKGCNVRIILSSVSGDTTAGGKARLDWALIEKPDAFLLELGANDGLRGIDPSVSRENLESIIKKLKKNRVKTLIVGMFAPPNLGKEYSREFNNIFSSLAKKYSLLFYPFFLEGVAANPQLNQADGIHPNPKGVDEIIKRMLPIVMKLVR